MYGAKAGTRFFGAGATRAPTTTRASRLWVAALPRRLIRRGGKSPCTYHSHEQLWSNIKKMKQKKNHHHPPPAMQAALLHPTSLPHSHLLQITSYCLSQLSSQSTSGVPPIYRFFFPSPSALLLLLVFIAHMACLLSACPCFWPSVSQLAQLMGVR